MEKRICKTCGGAVKRSGNFYVCEYCGNTWEIDRADDIHAVDRANAWASLRDGEFEKAAEQFEHIYSEEKDNYEAYWGYALAVNGISYVTDLAEDKKVPTCNNISEESFLESREVRKAVQLAPEEIRKSYTKQAELIEKIRLEWLQEARKEPPYDVFICYKDSDLESGIERTQDSIDAQDLYNALTEEGFRVFFSRVSLRDKVAERYEPYIYNAIKTAKVMILFGEKPEYFRSVWVKNEWNRFKLRITKGEKHRNSLVVVYKDMNPSELPVVLRSRQCLNWEDITFFSDLIRHIKRVIAESRNDEQIQRIEIRGGQIAGKATSIHVNAVTVRDVGQGMITETSISERQAADLLESYVRSSKWEDVRAQAEDMLFENPGCAEAIWYGLFARYEAENEERLFGLVKISDTDTFLQIQKAIDCASVEFADHILRAIYRCIHACCENVQVKLLEIVLPYRFPNRARCIEAAFSETIAHSAYRPFCVLLTTLSNSQVDAYIEYYCQFMHAAEDIHLKEECCRKIVDVDPGNIQALRQMLQNALWKNQTEQMVPRLENLLRFSPDPDEEVIRMVKWLAQEAQTPEQVQFAYRLIRYYSKDLCEISSLLVTLSGRMIKIGQFQSAERLLKLVMGPESENPDVYWNLCLIRSQAKEKSQLLASRTVLHDIPEYKKYLALVDEQLRKKCYSIEEEQLRMRCDEIWKQCLQRAGISTAGDGFECSINGVSMLVEMDEYQKLIQMAHDPDKTYYIVSGFNQIGEVICGVEQRIKECKLQILEPLDQNARIGAVAAGISLAVSILLFLVIKDFKIFGAIPLFAFGYFCAFNVLPSLVRYFTNYNHIQQCRYELRKRENQLENLYELEKNTQEKQNNSAE